MATAHNPELNTSRVLSTVVGSKAKLSLPLSLVDTDVQKILLDEIAGALSRGASEISIDLSQQKVLSSVALENLLEALDLTEQRSARLQLINASTLLEELFFITGVDRRITISREKSGSNQISGKQRLGDILVARGTMTEQQLTEALNLQKSSGKRLGEVLIEKGWATDQDVLSALSRQLSVPEVKLRPGLFDPAITKLIDLSTIKRLHVYPLFKIHDELSLAMANPQNSPALREVEGLTGCRVRPVLANADDILSLVNESDNSIDLGVELLADVDEDFEVVESAVQDLDANESIANGSPVINLVNSLIQRAVRDGASDVHIEPSRDRCRVRFRIDGVLYEVMTLRSELLPVLVSRLKVMANLDIAERRLPQDGRVQVITQGRSVDLRFSSLPGLYGEKVVLRVLDRNQAILKLNRLGMAEVNLTNYRTLLGRGYGLILVTGPTGAGKTTSLYAALSELNSMEKNIVTIEDPVEYQLDVINQNEVRNPIGLNFAKILKHTLRQDPDIIMVGEIREQETANIAVQAALTGHLVLSTLHTNDSAGAITRMIDMGVEPYLLSSALIGVMAQRLVRKTCESCKTSFVAPPELVKRYHWPKTKPVTLTKGRGCPDCYDSGYRGRLAIHETLMVDDRLQRLIISNPSRDQLTAHLEEFNIPTLFEDGIHRVREGLTTIEEISRSVNG